MKMSNAEWTFAAVSGGGWWQEFVERVKDEYGGTPELVSISKRGLLTVHTYSVTDRDGNKTNITMLLYPDDWYESLF